MENTETMTEVNNQMLEQVAIEETPFTAVRLDEKWFLTMGKYRLTETLQSLEECKEAAKDASWIRIMQIINIMIKENENEREKTKLHLESDKGVTNGKKTRNNKGEQRESN